MIKILNKSILVNGWLVLVMQFTLIAGVEAADHEVGHQHGHHEMTSLSLNDGKKWQTDHVLREAMQSINNEANKIASSFHHNELKKSEAEKMAVHVKDKVAFMIANCKLDPKADAVLHVLIGDLLAAADKLANDSQSHEGLPEIIKALQHYYDYFDHNDFVKN